MNFSGLLEKIKVLYTEIERIETEKRNMLLTNSYEDVEVRQEDLDYSHIYSELKQILLPMLNSYKIIFKTKYADQAKKVYFVAICEMMKQDYNRGMLITYRMVTGEDYVDTNKYYELLHIVSVSQKLNVIKQGNRRLFDRSYVLETGIPKNLTRYVIKMFNIYWRYFRKMDIGERREIIHDYIEGNEFKKEYILNPAEARIFEDYREYLKEFPEKSIRVFDKLDLIFSTLDEYENIMVSENDTRFLREVNKKLGFDVTAVLRNSDMNRIYYSYLQQIPISKFTSVLNNLLKTDIITLPTGEQTTTARISRNSVDCGEYVIRGISYSVVIDPVISLDDMLNAICNEIIELATDYFMYVSRDYFEVEIDGRMISPRRLYYRGQERVVWIGKLNAASVAYVDGVKLLSSEKFKLSSKIVKAYNAEHNQSRLVYRLSQFKACYPEYRYKRMFCTFNDQEDQIICVGNPDGVFYRENYRLEIPEGREHNVSFKIDGNIVYSEEIVLSSMYLFDKWNGTLYTSEGKNEKHSGAFVLFTTQERDVEELQYSITNEYKWNEFFVVEFVTSRAEKIVTVGDYTYDFEKMSKPYFFIWSDNDPTEYIDDISDVKVRVANLDQDQYWFDVENEGEHHRVSIVNGEYRLTELIEETLAVETGKWTCSLWQKQKKIDEENFIVVPQIRVIQKEAIVMEGKAVVVTVKATEECFISDDGGYCDSIDVSIGDAALEVEGGRVFAPKLESSVYLDKLGVMKDIVVNPRIWGVRIKEKAKSEWSKDLLVTVNPHDPVSTMLFVCSSGNASLIVNEQRMKIVPGLNKVFWIDYIELLTNKSELWISDSRHSYKQIFACNPEYSYVAKKIEERVVVTISYAGPVGEELSIRYFCGDELIRTISRKTSKNSFLMHIQVGEYVDVVGKRIRIDIRNARAHIPTLLFDEVIEVKDQLLVARDEGKVSSIKEYRTVDQLVDYYFRKNHALKKNYSVEELIKRVQKE